MIKHPVAEPVIGFDKSPPGHRAAYTVNDQVPISLELPESRFSGGRELAVIAADLVPDVFEPAVQVGHYRSGISPSNGKLPPFHRAGTYPVGPIG